MRHSIRVRLLTVVILLGLLGLAQPPVLRAAPQATLTIIVNSGGDGNTRDSVLTLREALLIARGTLWQCLTDGEKAQIFDATWSGSAGCWDIADPDRSLEFDWIIFSSGVTTVTPTSELPPLYCYDKITSNFSTTRAVTITGVAAGNASGLVLDCPNANANTSVQYLTISHFARSAIYGAGIQLAWLNGLQLNNNGMSGIYLTYNNTTSRNPRSITIGTSNAVDRNFIFGNGADGIYLEANAAYDTGALNNKIQNSYIGLDSSGITDQGNAGVGIHLINVWNSTIGGNAANLGNVIGGNNDTGVVISGAGSVNNVLYKNFIGTNSSGTVAIPNGFGVVIQNSADNNLIGDGNLGNVISGNTYDGVRLKDSGTTGNGIYSNTIGLNTSATAKLANGWSGIAIFNGAANNYVGQLGKGNIISGNGGGVYISDPNTQGNLVISNTIGTNGSSASGLGNINQGVGLYYSATQNFIGLSSAGYGNIIAGNGGPGVDLGHSVYNNFVWGNTIGTNAAGTAALGNSIGVRLWDGVYKNEIGTAFSPAGRNLISGNSSYGVGVYDANTISNTIAGNSIGTNRAGTAKVTNANGGVLVQLAASTVISTNLISGNGGSGLSIDGARDSHVENNIIGTNGNGSSALSNNGSGVSVMNNAVRTTIGTTTTLAGRNLISGNNDDGIALTAALSTTIEFNLIGLNLNGTSAIANANNGIGVYNSTHTQIGPNGGQGKYQYVSGNGQHGIYIGSSTDNYIGYSNRIGYATDDTSPIGNAWAGVMLNGTQNSVVYAVIGNNGNEGVGLLGAANNNRLMPLINKNNGGMPIDLGDDGPTANDPGDVDTGPNGLLNYPVITATNGSTITGTACANCTVYIYARFGNPRAAGGGAQFTGQYAYANANGIWNRTLTGNLLPISVTVQACQAVDCISAPLYVNTSELSPVFSNSGPGKIYLPLVMQSSGTVLNPPSAPTNLIAVPVSSSRIQLTWADNASNEMGFRIEQANGLGFSAVLTVGANVTRTNITGLSASTTYTYQVQAYNADGYSSYSNRASATTPAVISLPNAPTQLTASAASTSTIQLTWSDQATNELGFRIDQASSLGSSSIFTVSANVTHTTLSGLSASTTYTYQVRAFNAAGYSGYSNSTSATTLAAVTRAPEAPTQLVAVTASTTDINLTWLDKATNEDGFKIEQATGVGSATFSQVKLVGANVTNTIVTGLTPGTSYTFRVRAYNAIGNSSYSNLADAVTRANGAVPAAPSDLTAITLTPVDRLGLDWTDNSTNETEFVIERSRDGNVWTLEGGTGAPNIVSVDITELLSNTRYCFRVRARNANGDSYPSNTACATTATAAPPAAPISVTLQTISSTAVLLTWINPTSNNGYKVYESENGGTFALLGTLNQGNLDGTYIYGTVPGNTYAYKVVAFNTYGDSPQSAASNTVTAPAPAGSTVTRFKNNAAYPIISLQIDGVEQFPSEPQGIPSSAVFEKPLNVGQHTYRAATGFWSYGSRVEMYVYNGTFSQQNGVPGSITLNNPTLGQILTRFGSSGYYVGEFWSGTNLNSKGFRFYSNGSCTYYLNGAAQAGACSTTLVSYLGDFIVTFNVTYSQGTFQASMDERTGTFYLQNGPSDWRTIQYTYDGY